MEMVLPGKCEVPNKNIYSAGIALRPDLKIMLGTNVCRWDLENGECGMYVDIIYPQHSGFRLALSEFSQKFVTRLFDKNIISLRVFRCIWKSGEVIESLLASALTAALIPETHVVFLPESNGVKVSVQIEYEGEVHLQEFHVKAPRALAVLINDKTSD